MLEGIEVYLRPLGGGAILNIYVPAALTDVFVKSLQEGSFSEPQIPIAFEMSVLPSWFTNEHDQHVRVAVSSINVVASDEDEADDT